MNRRLAAACVVACGAVVAVAPPATAVQGVTSGWWWREQPAGGGLAAPPHVPARAVRIASDASGPSAVSAVRIALSPGEAAPVLTLKVSGGSMGAAVVNACPVAGPWAAASAGPWGSRPQPECTGGSAVGLASTDGTTVVFDLSTVPVGADGAVDVVLFPSPQPLPADPGALPVPVPEVWPVFDVVFAEPTAADVAVTPGPVGSGEAPAALADPAFDLGTTTMLETPLGAALDLGLLGDPPAAAPATGTAPSPARGAAAPAAAAPFQQLVGSWDRVGEARDRLLAAFVFVDLLAGWWWLERRRAKLGLDVDARPRITLHDDPAVVLAAHAARLARRPVRPDFDIPPLR